jgi:hypothetical protein
MKDWIFLFYDYYRILFKSRIFEEYYSIIIYIIKNLDFRIYLRLLRLLKYLNSMNIIYSIKERNNMISMIIWILMDSIIFYEDRYFRLNIWYFIENN